jgi:thymidylate synthase ThyX
MGWEFAPKVTLVESPHVPPSHLALGAARTCYSKRFMRPEDVVKEGRLDDRGKSILKSIGDAGHNTTRQHAMLTFEVADVSRQFLWQFLHVHPFYNSEQVSQRYVEIKPGAYVTPPLRSDAAKRVFSSTCESLFTAYEEIKRDLLPVCRAELTRRFPKYNSDRWTKELESNAEKRAQEVARYVAPVATKAFLYHTVSTNVLERYVAASQVLGTTGEQLAVVKQMESLLRELDPDYVTLPREVALEETAEYRSAINHLRGADISGGDIDAYVRDPSVIAGIHSFRAAFDARLDGLTSRLLPGSEHNEELLAQAVRDVICRQDLSLDEAIRFAMDMSINPHVYTPSNTATLSPFARAMQTVHYSFEKRLSHTADSQDQRHRMTPGSRPVLMLEVGANPDYLIPTLVRIAGGDVERNYRAAMETAWGGIGELLRMGEPAESVQYLFPNAKAIRFAQGTNLLNFQYKNTLRQCLNAQEEIWQATVEEAKQVLEKNPAIGRFLLPPCGHRKAAHVAPFCPEGARYCGVRVWDMPQEEFLKYERMI